MELSIFLAKVLGAYLVITSISLFLNKKKFKNLMDNLKHNPSAMFISGSISLLIGLLIVIAHNVWEADWRVAITLLGWIILMKGIVKTVFPQADQRLLTRCMKQNYTYHICSLFSLILGLYLCYFGFMS